jgi:hypothetical protein
MNVPELGALLTDLAVSCVATQQILNKQLRSNLDLFAEAIHDAPPELIDVYRPLIPTQQLIRSLDIAVRASIGVTRSAGFKIEVRPLNAWFSIVHKTRSEQESWIGVTVQQIPLPHNHKEKSHGSQQTH